MLINSATSKNQIHLGTLVNEQRLWNNHIELAKIGAISDIGVNRQAFTIEETEAKNKLIEMMLSQNFKIYADEFANIFIRKEGIDNSLPAIVTGSHIDTQPQGGRFDGASGVLCGIEALLILQENNIKTKHPLEVVIWSNEEGCRFAPGAMGSSVYTKSISIESLIDNKDNNGISLGDALKSSLEKLYKPLKNRPLNTAFHSYIELHIEQGPILESNNKHIGIVSGIQGVHWFNVKIKGQSSHAGTTPIEHRKDAVQAFVYITNQLNEYIGNLPKDIRFTIGSLDVSPNAINTIAEEVNFTIDLRYYNDDLLNEISNNIYKICNQNIKNCNIISTIRFKQPPCIFDNNLVSIVKHSACSLNQEYESIISGAFHDALLVNKICPTAMIFIPCKNGVSHHPTELTTIESLSAGTKVLLMSLLNQTELHFS